MQALGLSLNGPPFEDLRTVDDHCIPSIPIGNIRASLRSIRHLEVKSGFLQSQASRAHDRKHRRDCRCTCDELAWDDCFLTAFPELRSVIQYAHLTSNDRDQKHVILVVPGNRKPQNVVPPYSLNHLIRRIDGGFRRKYFEGEIWKTKAEEAGIRMRWTLVLWLSMDILIMLAEDRRWVPRWRHVHISTTMTFEKCVLRFELEGQRFELPQLP